jgi:hypothetical protein
VPLLDHPTLPVAGEAARSGRPRACRSGYAS